AAPARSDESLSRPGDCRSSGRGAVGHRRRRGRPRDVDPGDGTKPGQRHHSPNHETIGSQPLMPSRLAVAFALIVSIFLHGCAQQPLSPVDNFERYRQALTKVEDWRLQGKMNLRVPGESETVRVNWSNSAENYSIRLSGSLGIGATWIRGDASGVRMERSGEETIFAATPEDLVYTLLGRDLPI